MGTRKWLFVDKANKQISFKLLSIELMDKFDDFLMFLVHF
jgi:hypothetical protein